MLCLTCVIINVKRRVERGAVSVLNEGRLGGIQRGVHGCIENKKTYVLRYEY